jgi:hypothetical protein
MSQPKEKQMNKQDAIQKTQHLQQQMKEMQEQLKKLQEVIEAPEEKTSLLQVPEAGSGDKYGIIGNIIMDELAGITRYAHSKRDREYTHGNVFQTQELAEEYAKAIDTMLLLRHQKGSVPVKDTEQYTIEEDDDSLVVESWTCVFNKTRVISPCFETEEDALNAIQNVGEDNIKHMFATFHHTKF